MFLTTVRIHRHHVRIVSSAAVALVASLSVGCAGHQAAAPGHKALIGHSAPRHTVKLHTVARHGAQRVKGGIAPGALAC